MNKQDFIETFLEAIEEEADFIGVAVQMDTMEEPEIIINPNKNFRTKLEYYQKAYDDEMQLKANPGIQIVACAYGDFIEDIIETLL